MWEFKRSDLLIEGCSREGCLMVIGKVFKCPEIQNGIRQRHECRN